MVQVVGPDAKAYKLPKKLLQDGRVVIDAFEKNALTEQDGPCPTQALDDCGDVGRQFIWMVCVDCDIERRSIGLGPLEDFDQLIIDGSGIDDGHAGMHAYDLNVRDGAQSFENGT